MRGFRLSIAVVLMLACLAPLPSGAVAAGDYEAVLDRGLRNNEPYSYVLGRRAEASGAGERVRLLEEALRQSPDLPVLYFRLSWALLAASPSNVLRSIDYLVEGLRTYQRSFWWSLSLAGLLYVTLLGSFLLALAAVALLRLPRELPLLAHDAVENPKTLLLPALLLLLSFVGPVFFLAGLLGVMSLYLRGMNKAVAYLALAAVAASPYLLRPANLFLSASTPTQRAMVEVNEGRDNRFALNALAEARDFPARFSHALALKREGRYNRAIVFYEDLTLKQPGPRVYTNLGNSYLAAGLLEEAKEAYRKALEMSPSAALLYNLSQVHRDTLDFKAGDRYFLEAVEMDRDKVSQFTDIASRDPNRFVIDETLTMRELWEAADRNRRALIQPFAVNPGFAAFVAAAVIPLLIVLDRKMRPRATRCSRCGAVMCARCTPAMQRQQTCPDCHGSLVKLTDVDPGERVSKLLAVHDRKSRVRGVAKVLSYAPPGIAHISAGKVLAGFFFLWLFLWGALALGLNPLFATGVAPYEHGWLNPLLVAVLGALYLASHLSMKRRLARGWL